MQTPHTAEVTKLATAIRENFRRLIAGTMNRVEFRMRQSALWDRAHQIRATREVLEVAATGE